MGHARLLGLPGYLLLYASALWMLIALLTPRLMPCSPHNRWNPIRIMLNNFRYSLMDAKFAGPLESLLAASSRFRSLARWTGRLPCTALMPLQCRRPPHRPHPLLLPLQARRCCGAAACLIQSCGPAA